MECYQRSVEFQKKWDSYMSLQFFDEEFYTQMNKEFDELQEFCMNADTYEESVECYERTREYQNKWQATSYYSL
jgi:hypothetical protein